MVAYEDLIYKRSLGSSDTITKLAIFDFDSTLFKSPLPNPEIWSSNFLGKIISDCQWFLEERTLGVPGLPSVPGPEWWNLSILETAKRSISTKDTLTILMTGRRKSVFECRILELLKQQNLVFDLVLLKEVKTINETTMDFKYQAIQSILTNFSNIRSIKLFDDRAQHVKLFQKTFEEWISKGIIDDFDTEHVCIDDDIYMDKEYEKQLVLDFIEQCNQRIKNCQSRLSNITDQSSKLSLQTESLSSITENDQIHSPTKPLKQKKKSNTIEYMRYGYNKYANLFDLFDLFDSFEYIFEKID